VVPDTCPVKLRAASRRLERESVGERKRDADGRSKRTLSLVIFRQSIFSLKNEAGGGSESTDAGIPFRIVFDAFGADQREAVNQPQARVFGFHSY
jgi:hypothetical protein